MWSADEPTTAAIASEAEPEFPTHLAGQTTAHRLRSLDGTMPGRSFEDVGVEPSNDEGAALLPLWGSFLHALAEATTGFLTRRLRASLHPTAEAAAAQAAEPPREPFAKATETASRRTATHALGKALLGLVGCGGVLIRRCHRVGPLLVPVADGPEATVGIGWSTARLSGTTTTPARAGADSKR
jgi:hypothetical protein